ncbi:HAD family hydrolase [Patescibacteria group bacterium]
MPIKAIIFDLNGTVLDDEHIYASAFRNVLKSLGQEVDDAEHVLGIGVAENWPILLRKFKIKTKKTAHELASLTTKEYLKLFDSEVVLTKGFEEFAQNVRESGISTALATSNSWEVVEKAFDKFGIDKYFECVTTGEEVTQKKPSPESFLLTADKLGVEPKMCVVIEDADSGIEAAKSADMMVIAIQNANAEANFNISDFTDLTPERLASLIQGKMKHDNNDKNFPRDKK